MNQEEAIAAELTRRFEFLKDKIRIPRPRRIFVETGLENFTAVFDFIVKQLDFPHLCTITGLDEQENLSFIYHLTQEKGILLNLKTSVPKENPVIKTVIPYFPSAEIYERELEDLFGAKVEGLPSGNRYPLTDDWPKDIFPLRKDYKTAKEQKNA